MNAVKITNRNPGIITSFVPLVVSVPSMYILLWDKLLLTSCTVFVSQKCLASMIIHCVTLYMVSCYL